MSFLGYKTTLLISLERKETFQKRKRNSSVFGRAVQISSNYFSFHRDLNNNVCNSLNTPEDNSQNDQLFR